MSRFRPRWLVPAVVISLVAVSAWAVPAAGDQPTPGTANAPAAQSTAPLTITLVTGDKVIARRGPNGTFATDVRPASGREGMVFHKTSLGKQQSVIPLDAMPLVSAGIVDARLFDIALLAELGLDDASAPKLPLLVQYSGTARAARSALPEGTEVKRELPLVDAVAIGQERSQAADLWWSWTNNAQAKKRTGLAGTVKKVFLDGGITPNLDRSAAQIGAPTAWKSGVTGKELPSYDQTLSILDRTGKPAVNDEGHVAGAFLLDVDHKVLYNMPAGGTLRLPRGRYAVDGYAAKFNPDGIGFGEVTYFAEPDVIIDKTGTIAFDGRKAAKIAVKAPVTGAVAATAGVGFVRTLGDTTYGGGIGVANSFRPDFSPDMYVAQNTTGTTKDFTGYAHAAWAGMPDGQSPEGDFYLDSPYLYHDVATWPGRFPAKPSLITKPSEYAHLDASYAGEPGNRANNYGYPTLPKKDASGHWTPLFVFTPSVAMNLPFRRDEYYSTKNVSWAFENELYRRLPNNDVEYTALVDSQHVAYPAGRTTPIQWQHGVFGPSSPDSRGGMPGRDPVKWSFRDGDSLTIVALMYADGGAGRFGDALVDSEHTTLVRDGVEIGASDSAKQQTFAVPADDGRYELTKVVKRSAERFLLSTEISSKWTFRSARTSDGVESALGMMNVRYAPALDDRNRAAGGRFEVPLTVEHQFGAKAWPVLSVKVQASFDDGMTWRDVPVRRTGAGWKATVEQPSSGFVSLRAIATDAAGNEVDQTIQRAYALR